MSTHVTVAAPRPTAAEHVRTVLSRAISLSLTTAGRDYDLIGMHSVGTDGTITLHPQAGSLLAQQIAEASDGGLAALLEFTDIAPTAVRNRVRARVTVSGRLTPTDGDELRLDSARVRLGTPGGTVDIDPEEFAFTQADPLAVEEAAVLTHLVDSHGELTEQLLDLAGSQVPGGIVRAVPYALDRHSITLRCEYAVGHCDVRLLFPAPARDAAEAGERIRQLLTEPCHCPNHSRTDPRS
ncbi:DUF2470 domain-containing protein [Streptomyces sp. NK15101]|uniref:DUF2470 domain-containing protein n=1 Tax=Streptomyces sp. NK15101 TaxID=2873261 RepID=UPI001CEDADEF|nr:DUF2470 domain-containing protein [Streptomyces sp. NK15101]